MRHQRKSILASRLTAAQPERIPLHRKAVGVRPKRGISLLHILADVVQNRLLESAALDSLYHARDVSRHLLVGQRMLVRLVVHLDGNNGRLSSVCVSGVSVLVLHKLFQIVLHHKGGLFGSCVL